ncbi:hypothetical protein B277_00255 [Janibacter hoylei PVAS-1]|uniref:Uncharacterized protein n=1 Tax=Janibacter hoylei PVAS-1 TaxID=1210046 RepID=K1E1U3_9MICO|nr:hypothetical protein [Janibacter hoylei]EKA62845.1 hypothetical protein B277_00255 [Janibacter hoylei PVAS-1]RWU82116.1 hypothetical protein CWN80_12815 [Janibacter hoylei PVAS-1]
MHPMRIRANQAIAILLVCLGVLMLAVGILAQSASAAVGVILAVLGVLQMINPMVRLEPHEARVISPIGITMRRFPLRGPLDLVIDGKNLVHVPTGKRVTTLGFGVHQPDVEALRHVIPTAQR